MSHRHWHSGGGGIYVESSDIELANLWVHDNKAEVGGGIAFEIGTVQLSNSAITDNESKNFAGGIYQFGVTTIGEAHLEVRNSTISGNVASTAGGALLAFGASFIVMEYTTVAKNTNRPGDATMFGFLSSSRVEVLFTLVEGTCTAGPDTKCIYLTSTVDEIPVPDLGIEPLAFNGGVSPTHRLHASSPALDIVPLGAACPSTDQRGIGRPLDGDGDGTPACDAGAYELAAASPVAVPGPGLLARLLLVCLLATLGTTSLRR